MNHELHSTSGRKCILSITQGDIYHIVRECIKYRRNAKLGKKLLRYLSYVECKPPEELHKHIVGTTIPSCMLSELQEDLAYYGNEYH